MEKLFRENKTSPLLKTPEKDFHLYQFIGYFILAFVHTIDWHFQPCKMHLHATLSLLVSLIFFLVSKLKVTKSIPEPIKIIRSSNQIKQQKC